MSLCKINVCKLILRDHFGELTEQVGLFLLKKGSCTLRYISTETKLKTDQVRLHVVQRFFSLSGITLHLNKFFNA